MHLSNDIQAKRKVVCSTIIIIVHQGRENNFYLEYLLNVSKRMKKKEGQNSTFLVSGNLLNTQNVFGQKLPIISFLKNLYSLAEIFSQVLTSKHSTQDQR